MVAYSPEEIRLARLLRGIALAATAACLITLVGAYVGPSTTFFVEPPFVSNTVAAVGLLALLAWFAAADVRRFRAMIATLVGGFALGAVILALLYFSPDGSAQGALLLVSAALCAALALIVGGFASQARSPAPPWTPWMTDKALSGWERVGRLLCGLLGVGAAVAVIGHAVFSYTGPAGLVAFFRQPLMVGGSAVKIGMLAACLLLAAWDIRRHREMLTVFILGNAVSLVAVIVTHLGINQFGDAAVTVEGFTTTARNVMFGALLLDAGVVVVFAILLLMMNRRLLDHLGFFAPLQFRALEAIAETLIEGSDLEAVPPTRSRCAPTPT